MSNEQFIGDFGKYIESKIKARNKCAEKGTENNSLLEFLDREITFLESCEKLIMVNIIEGEKALKAAKVASFQLGIKSGLLEAKTGREHPEYLLSQK